MAETEPPEQMLILHDWSPLTGHCYGCGVHMVGAPPVCEPTTAEPEQC